MSFFISAIAGLLSGLLGGMGLGGGGVLIIYLTLFENMEQKVAQGINLMFFIPCAIIAVIYYFKKKLIDIKVLSFLIVSGLVGAFIGNLAIAYIDSYILGKIFAGLLLFMGLRQIFSKNQ